MSRALGLGPVFEVEWLTTARKWQVYAGRSLFVFALLAGMTIVWIGSMAGKNLTMRGQAQVGGTIFEVIVVTQLALVLLAAPAATAGTICLDRARGNLAHLFTTDLGDAEIVLGKLAARLVPVVGCVCCTLPVMALTTLLGGIDPVDLTGAFVITLAVAVLGCAVAMFLSVWASKPHEVMMGTCLLWAAWLLLEVMWEGIEQVFPGLGVPSWLEWIGLFNVALGSVGRQNQSIIVEQILFAGGVLAVAAVLVALTIWRMRPAAIRQMGRGEVRKERRPEAFAPHRIPLPGPTLDENPVLWREWHRQKPSRWVRVVGSIYYLIVGFFSALVLYALVTNGLKTGPSDEFGALVVAFTVSIGMLLIAVRVPAALVEERVRGSLDVLMTTPLSTRLIVEGKWWGAFRSSAMLAILPGILTAFTFLAYVASLPSPFALDLSLLVAPGLMVSWILSYAAFLTSLGLALATWLKKLGRALALTVMAHVLLTVGLPMTIMGLLDGPHRENLGFALMCGSAFWGPGLMMVELEQPHHGASSAAIACGAFLWSVAFLVGALLLLAATISTFDRCMGRSTFASDPSRHLPARKPTIPALVE